MFTVKECTQYEEGSALCARLGGSAQEGDRLFVLEEGEPIGVGVLGLRNGKVIVKGVYGTLSPAYRDVLLRSLLHVCRCLDPITVRVEGTDGYYKPFGFTENDGGMEVLNTDISFH